MQKIPINGHDFEFIRYKYSFYEYLYHFMREAQQTPRGGGIAGDYPAAVVCGGITGDFPAGHGKRTSNAWIYQGSCIYFFEGMMEKVPYIPKNEV
jgi:hypothetical protein